MLKVMLVTVNVNTWWIMVKFYDKIKNLMPKMCQVFRYIHEMKITTTTSILLHVLRYTGIWAKLRHFTCDLRVAGSSPSHDTAWLFLR